MKVFRYESENAPNSRKRIFSAKILIIYIILSPYSDDSKQIDAMFNLCVYCAEKRKEIMHLLL